MSRFFIQRPIFATVISLIIVLAGFMAMRNLPIAQSPQIAPPTVTITANYPGASAETLSKTVAAPIEEQLNGVEGMAYFSSSSSSNGTTTVSVVFEVGTDIDQATINVNNRMKAAEPRLPDEVRRNGVLVQKRSTDILLVVSMMSPSNKYDTLFLSNYSTINVVDDLKRVKGVADITVFGARDYSMRIWVRPEKLAQLGLTPSDIAQAIRSQNQQYAAGKIGQEPAVSGQSLVYTVTSKGRLTEPEEFGNIILRANGPNGVLRLKDVARIELGAQNYDLSTTLDGKPTVGLVVFLQSGANALDVADSVRSKMEEIKQKFPEGVAYLIPFDTTRFVKASIQEVVHTLLEAAILVVFVVFLFLQNWRATLIPIIAVPVSLIGTFAGLYVLGFSINTLTLFAMVLAIGIVVDDAIVVLENVERLMNDHGMTPFNAAVEAMREVSTAVVAIVLVLCAVFVPVAFLGGIAGKLYQQFAVTIAIAVVISGVVALTLTPALCALLLKPTHHEAIWFKPFNRFFSWLTRAYTGSVKVFIRHTLMGLTLFAVVIGAGFFLVKRIPTGFMPSEDQGFLYSAMVLPDGASLQRTSNFAKQVQEMVAKTPEVDHVFAVAGFDLIGGGNKTNAGTAFITLKPWATRTRGAEEIAKNLGGQGMTLRDGMFLVFNPPPIRGLGTAGGFEVYLQTKTESDPKKFAEVMKQFVETLKTKKELVGINTFFRPTTPQLSLEIDREKAIALGVPVNDIFDALQSTMGSLYVNDFNKFGRTYRVQLQAEDVYRGNPEDLGKVYVRSQTGNMLPLSALIQTKIVVGAEQLERFNGLLGAKILGSGAPGISSGDAIKLVETVAQQTLPEGYQLAWSGQAFQEKRINNSSIIAFSFAVVMVFLILAAQFEAWSLPLAVILAIPFALLGALLAILVRGMPNDIYFQIGIVTLIGLAAKNAILIVEFAAQKIDEGFSVMDASIEAAKLRFRPIVMTSLAFVLGVVPLVIASGAGAAARRSMGTGVFGGMLAATFVATLFIPMFFVLFLRQKKLKKKNEAGRVELEKTPKDKSQDQVQGSTHE